MRWELDLGDIDPVHRRLAEGTGSEAERRGIDLAVRIWTCLLAITTANKVEQNGLPLLLLIIRRYLLAMLETAVGRRAILLAVVLLLLATIITLIALLLLLRRIAGLLVTALVITALLRWVWALTLRGILLVTLVVLVVRAGHCDCRFWEFVGLRM